MSIFERLFGNKEKEDDGLTRDFSFGSAEDSQFSGLGEMPNEVDFYKGQTPVDYTSYSGLERAEGRISTPKGLDYISSVNMPGEQLLIDEEVEELRKNIDNQILKQSANVSDAALQGASGSQMLKTSNENFLSGLNSTPPNKKPVPKLPNLNIDKEIKMPISTAQPLSPEERGLPLKELNDYLNQPITKEVMTSKGPQELQISTTGQDLDMMNIMKNEGIINEDGDRVPVVDQGLYSTEEKKVKTTDDGKEIKMVGIGEVAQFTGKGLETETAYKGYIPESQLEIYNDIQKQKELQKQVDEERNAGIISRVIYDSDSKGRRIPGTTRIVYPTRRRGLPQTDSGTGVVQGGLLEGENVSSSIGQTLRNRAGDVSMKANRNRTNMVAQEALDLFKAAGINPDVDFNASDNVAILNALDNMGSISESKSDKGRAALNLIINNAVANREKITDQTIRTEERTDLTTARNEQIDAEFENLAKRVASGDADQQEIDTFYDTAEKNISLDKTLNPDDAATSKLSLFKSYAGTIDTMLDSLQDDYDAEINENKKDDIYKKMEALREFVQERSKETNKYLQGLDNQTIEKIKAKAKANPDLTQQEQRDFERGVNGVIKFLSSSNAEEIDGVIQSLQDPLYNKAINSPLYVDRMSNIKQKIVDTIKNNESITNEQKLKLGNILFVSAESLGLDLKVKAVEDYLNIFLKYDKENNKGKNKKKIETIDFNKTLEAINKQTNDNSRENAQDAFNRGDYTYLSSRGYLRQK